MLPQFVIQLKGSLTIAKTTAISHHCHHPLSHADDSEFPLVLFAFEKSTAKQFQLAIFAKNQSDFSIVIIIIIINSTILMTSTTATALIVVFPQLVPQGQ